MGHARFVHLHLHTDYSLLDGMCKIDKLAELGAKYEFPALAITDHGNMFGAIEFYEAMESAGVKPIIGEEVYVAPGALTQKESVNGISSFHLTLLVKNEEGYKNLMWLSSIAYLEGFYYKPRIDKSVLKEHSNGLIGLSGCLKGEIPYWIKKGKSEQAKKVAEEYRELFGEDNFYLELMRLGLPDNDLVDAELVKLSKELGIPLVATNDCHYLSEEDVEAHDILLCLQTHSDIDDDKRLKFDSKELYFKSPQEMEALFSDHPDAIENTIRIAEQCNLRLELDPTRVKIPRFPIPSEYKSADEYLETLAAEGLKRRYKEPISPDIIERFKYELDTIKRTGFSAYFLIVKDIIDAARKNGIPVGPGRGSTAGSLVCYCLEITQLDPIKHGLIFERFLNPERVSPPDIDVDFCDERRDEVIKYIRKRYGEESVSQIITFGTMAARAAIRDVARVLKVPYPVADRLSKTIPFGAGIEEALALSEFKEVIQSNPELNKVVEIARKLEGLSRHASTHAAGVAIAPGKLTDFVPLFKSPDTGTISSQYAMHSLELIGIPKIDILGLRTLTVIDNTMRMVRIEEIPENDGRTFSLMKKGNTVGVFQLESEGMRDILRKLQPESFSDIMAVLALYRPGPLGGFTKDKFIHSRHGDEKVTYEHPKLEPILKETYGIILYQEQVMQIASEVAGFSLGEADILRRAMGKKIPALLDERRSAFMDGAIKRGVPEDVAHKIFELMIPFAGYGFNKSHSAGYALLSYWTAYLKANYPVEFMASTLTSESDNSDRVKVLIDECRRLKITVLRPDINSSDVDFIPVDHEREIKFGLSALKNLGRSAASEIVKKRPYKSFQDFLSRTNLNRKACETLVKAGAFDLIDHNRKKLLTQLNQQATLQLGLFKVEEPQAEEEVGGAELLSWEREAFGFYFSGHPLEKYQDELQAFTTVTADQIIGKSIGEEVVIGGIVVRKKYLKDKDISFLKLEDLTGSVDVVVFSDAEKPEKIELEDELIVKGRISRRDDEKSVRAIQIIKLSGVRKKFVKWVDIEVRILGLEKSALEELRKLLDDSPGECVVFLHLLGEDKEKIVLRTGVKVQPKRELLTRVRKLFGEHSIRLGGPPI